MAKVIDRDLGYAATMRALRELDDLRITIGLHADAEPYESGSGVPANVAQVASFHEFGDGVPQRSFIRPTVDGNQGKYGAMMQRGVGKVIDGDVSVKDLGGLVGVKVMADIQRAIVDLKAPPLSPETVARKTAKGGFDGTAQQRQAKAKAYAEGGANPLIDTGHMRQSVTYVVDTSGRPRKAAD